MVTQALNVWMNGELVGAWSVDRDTHIFRYAPGWLESPRRRSLSQSIPISSSLETRGEVVKNYFDNLLPDNEKIRSRLHARFKTRSAGPFDLLEAIGRDCVGAVQLLPENATPEGWDRIQCEPLSEERIVEILQAVPSDNLQRSVHDDDLFRISIAGAQEKTAFTWHEQRWCRPHGATPTTHIFKLPLGLIGGSRRVDATDSVQNEWLCARIMAALGFPVAQTEMARFGGQSVLVVERFDRMPADNGAWIVRLPQEDFCQALGLPPRKKYESDGGPGITKCMQLLQGSRNKADAALFLMTQLAFFLLAATDGHAKNFSIFQQFGDAYEMTPLYDILSMYPYFGSGPNQFNQRHAGPAMVLRSKNVHKHFYTIQARHWRRLAMAYGGTAVWQDMSGLAQRVRQALAAVATQLPDDFPERTWLAISEGMSGAAEKFLMEAGELK
ncbi:type II toxin-antitoxin system HipA family toxin [Oxalobacteraceae bacterium CAVE-383]|nr:type II toxin-antitoxin system HipA family toxin [Oxalobacteraceae bacterium CAVE-383]